ncbi:5-bromo-4-chloroindolyl phosphate hydrolysis family protein [Edaphobacillus lindanitolerans]|uniref:5-bromo-4-chloroindolyl phosphate hydrolysis protein n=1 Tax=Edaphobacillus lindanitolerans TaxID=550447 RepID=A0A1U7PPL7_9BACI|nr:5-bromo-4-chloroindolyl phosphate hydrolysis family protein [Edaphobacillus lindanitolerans]SIT80811.1 5-bromo-4-chloroindolyl phosphate hydrolysis protein [Edaphobacillus lindanitolerans]
MNNFQQFLTRQAIMLPVSFGSWLYFLLGAGMTFIPATGLLIAIYLAGDFSIRQVQTTSEVKRLGMTRSEYKHIEHQLSEAKSKLRQLNAHYGNIRSVQAFRQLNELNKLSKRIIGIVGQNPKKFYNVEKFFYAHLDSAVELSSKYALLANQPAKDPEMQATLQQTRETLTDLNEEIRKDVKRALTTDLETLKFELDYADVLTGKERKQLNTAETKSLPLEGDDPDDRKSTGS